jgi:hypothetical protein
MQSFAEHQVCGENTDDGAEHLKHDSHTAATRARLVRCLLQIPGTGRAIAACTFLLLTGYGQVRSIVAALAGDPEAADDVRLVLPETDVLTKIHEFYSR